MLPSPTFITQPAHTGSPPRCVLLGTIVALENTGNTNRPLRAQALAGLFNRQDGVGQ
jgi:hypothetical protein